MPRHTILVSISSEDGGSREVSLQGAGDLPHLVDVFGLALALMPATSVGDVPSPSLPYDATGPIHGESRHSESSQAPRPLSVRVRPRRFH